MKPPTRVNHPPAVPVPPDNRPLVAPIYQSVSTNLVSPQITGWVDNESDVHPIRYLCRNAAAPARPVPPP